MYLSNVDALSRLWLRLRACSRDSRDSGNNGGGLYLSVRSSGIEKARSFLDSPRRWRKVGKAEDLQIEREVVREPSEKALTWRYLLNVERTSAQPLSDANPS